MLDPSRTTIKLSVMKKTLVFLLGAVGLLYLNETSAQTYSWNNLPKITEPVFKKDTINVVSFGANGDGVTLNTKAINEAILSSSKKGGGVVLVPAGVWLTGPVELQSNVNLHLALNSTLLFTTDKDQYPLAEGVYEGRAVARNQSPISGKNLNNIAITGYGVIDGNGDAWRAVHKDQLTEPQWRDKLKTGGVLSENGRTWYPSEQFKKAAVEKRSMLLADGSLESFRNMKDYLRPNLLVLTNCKKVLLEGVTFQNSAAWCLHPLMCEDLTLRNLYIKNPEYAHNGDGIDIESCKNFLIEGCIVDVGDDAICIKSGKDEEGRKRGIPTENGVIRKNRIYAGHGAFVIGSEMSGGAKNIFVEDCTFMGTDKGLRFKSVRGRGGLVENIYARNIYMKDIVQEAIFFDMYYFVKFATDSPRDESTKVSEATPIFRNMKFENIVSVGSAKGIFVRGLPEMPIQNIVMENMVLESQIGAELIEAKNLVIKNTKFIPKNQNPVIFIENSQNIEFENVSYPEGSDVLFKVGGKVTQNINVKKTDTSKAKKVTEFLDGTNPAQLKIQK